VFYRRTRGHAGPVPNAIVRWSLGLVCAVTHVRRKISRGETEGLSAAPDPCVRYRPDRAPTSTYSRAIAIGETALASQHRGARILLHCVFTVLRQRNLLGRA
jgi:hypothetical protein